jgi:CRP-like cAMP-binding protein
MQISPTQDAASRARELPQHRFPFVQEESSGRLIPTGHLLRRSRYGSIFGEKDFCLDRTRRFTAVVMAEETALFFLTREKYNEMSRVHPQLALGFHQCITKSMALEIDRGTPWHTD